MKHIKGPFKSVWDAWKAYWKVAGKPSALELKRAFLISINAEDLVLRFGLADLMEAYVALGTPDPRQSADRRKRFLREGLPAIEGFFGPDLDRCFKGMLAITVNCFEEIGADTREFMYALAKHQFHLRRYWPAFVDLSISSGRHAYGYTWGVGALSHLYWGADSLRQTWDQLKKQDKILNWDWEHNPTGYDAMPFFDGLEGIADLIHKQDDLKRFITDIKAVRARKSDIFTHWRRHIKAEPARNLIARSNHDYDRHLVATLLSSPVIHRLESWGVVDNECDQLFKLLSNATEPVRTAERLTELVTWCDQKGWLWEEAATRIIRIANRTLPRRKHLEIRHFLWELKECKPDDGSEYECSSSRETK